MIKSDTIYIKTILLLSLNTPYVYNMKLDKSTQQTVKLGTRLYCTKFLLNQTTI